MAPNSCGAQNQWLSEDLVIESPIDEEYDDDRGINDGLPEADVQDVSYYEQQWCLLRAEMEQDRRNFEQIACEQLAMLQEVRGITERFRQLNAQINEILASNEALDFDCEQSCGECECSNYMGEEEEEHECD